MARLPAAPPGINLDDDRRASIVVTSLVTWCMAALVVGLRLASRRLKKIDLRIEDWFIIVALVCSSAHVFGMGAYAVSRGFGQHVWAGPPDAQYAWAIGLFIAKLGYFSAMACVKWSILAFYFRMFKIQGSVRLPIFSLALIVLLWAIAVIVLTILQCQPVTAWWERFNPTDPLQPKHYKCAVDSVKFFYGDAIPTIVTDLLILQFPLPYIGKLGLPKAQKWALGGVFVVGLFVSVVSIVRLHYSVHADFTGPDITWNYVDIALWSAVEGNTTIFCACLPFLWPVLSNFILRLCIRSSAPSGNEPSSGTRGTGGARRTSWYRQKDGARSWQGDGRFITASTHTRAYSVSRRHETDRHPFAHLNDHGSERSVPFKEGFYDSQIELANMAPPRIPLDPNVIVVTQEIHLRREDAPRPHI
ncbi:hypothetical protein ACQKWADRAFT_328433 [Trichoderma austrokoningii]